MKYNERALSKVLKKMIKDIKKGNMASVEVSSWGLKDLVKKYKEEFYASN